MQWMFPGFLEGVIPCTMPDQRLHCGGQATALAYCPHRVNPWEEVHRYPGRTRTPPHLLLLDTCDSATPAIDNEVHEH